MSEIMQYINRPGFFHRLNPLTKVVFVVAVVIMSVVSTSPALLAGLVVAIVIVAAVSGLSRELAKQIPLLISLSVSLVLLTVLTLQSGETLGYLIPSGIPVIGGHIPITAGALDLGVVMSLRFFAMLFAFQLMIISTQPRDLVHAMHTLRLPVDYTLMFLIALRFIPSLQLEGKRIQEAQLARAYNPGKGIAGRIRSLFPVIIPLVSSSLAKANVLGLTIDLRGYRAGKRTAFREPVMRSIDILGICCLAVLCGGFIVYAVL